MWFSKTAEEVLIELSVDPAYGLSDEEASTRLKKSGANKLLSKKKKSIFLMFFAQLKNWLIYILLGDRLILGFMSTIITSGRGFLVGAILAGLALQLTPLVLNEFNKLFI